MKTITIHIKDEPPCEFESLKDLKNYVAMHPPGKPTRTWKDVVVELKKKGSR